jgi:hypothetical protein
MLPFLYSLSVILTILIVWFKTDAYVEYCKIFNLNFLLFNYNHPELTFPQYLYSQRNTLFKKPFTVFYIKLITCPFCLSFWLSLIAAFVISNPLAVFPLYVCSLFLYLFLVKLLEH